MSSAPVVHHAPAFAGGRVGLLNQVLFAVLKARQQHSQATLVLDANRLQEQDFTLSVQNDHGDVVHVPVPDHGTLGHGSRAKLLLFLQDLLPQTADLAQCLDLVFPDAGQSPLDAAAHWWAKLLPELNIETVGYGASPKSPATSTSNTKLLWLSSRLHQVMKDYGFTHADLEQGENHCRQLLPRVPVGELESELRQLEDQVQQGLGRMKSLTAEVDASLVGAWVRLRRDLLAATEAFAQSADRGGRNRTGTRGARLHALAQVVRPHDQDQAEGLSLLSLVASHQWHPSRIESYLTSLESCRVPERLLLTD